MEARSLVEQQRVLKTREKRRRLDGQRETLQQAINAMDQKAVVEAIVSGAQIHNRHIGQAVAHFGDQYLPMLGLLLAMCPSYSATHALCNDASAQVMLSPSPLLSMVLGTHIDRWARRDISLREVGALTTDKGKRTSTTIL